MVGSPLVSGRLQCAEGCVAAAVGLMLLQPRKPSRQQSGIPGPLRSEYAADACGLAQKTAISIQPAKRNSRMRRPLSTLE